MPCVLARLYASAQIRHALDVLCLWKHIQWLHPRQFKDTIAAQNVQVARHRRRVAGDVDDLRWSRPAQYLQYIRFAALARRIEQHGRRSRVETREQRRQHIFRRTRNELAVEPPTSRGVPTRRLDRQTVQFDTDKGLDEVA